MKFLSAKNCIFRILIFAYFCFVSCFYLLCIFCTAKISLKKNWVCPNKLFYYTTDVYTLNPLWRAIFSPIFFYLCPLIFSCENLLWSSVRIFLICDNLWKSFWIFFICEHPIENLSLFFICMYVFLSMRIFTHQWLSVNIFSHPWLHK